MGVLGALFGGIGMAVSGPKKAPVVNNTPPINASSSDEADFITCVYLTTLRLRILFADP